MQGGDEQEENHLKHRYRLGILAYRGKNTLALMKYGNCRTPCQFIIFTACLLKKESSLIDGFSERTEIHAE